MSKEWSKNYKHCIVCKSIETRHCGNGLCERCYCAKRRRVKGMINKKKVCEHRIIKGIESAYCKKCDAWKSISDFTKGQRRRDGLKSFCRKCENKYYRGKRVDIDRRLTIKKAQKRNDRIKEVLNEQGGCKKCGVTYEDLNIYEFHHCDPTKKESRMSQLLCRSNDGWKQELQKCILVCSNCHRLIHANQERNPDYYKNDRYGKSRKADVERRRERSNSRKRNIIEKQDGCKVCGMKHEYMGIYDFHHVDKTQKEYAISKILTQAGDKWKEEIQKCILICSNCHRSIHASDLNR